MRTDAYYLALEGAYHRDPVQADFGPAWSLANPSGFRAYATMSRYSPDHDIHKIRDLYGRERWLNDKGWKVMCLALLKIAGDIETSLTEMATSIGCCRMTVSRWITKLTAWGVIGSSVLRGRYGGLFLFARKITDNLDRYAAIARAKIAAIRARKSNAHPPITGASEPLATGSYYPSSYSVSMGVHLDLADALQLDRSRSQGMIQCPAHEDQRKSLSWKMAGDKLLLHCFAGCTFAEIRMALA